MLLLCLLVWGQALADSGKCFLWEVKSEKATVYLLGSVHMMKPDGYPLDACIDAAFDRADTLVVELDMLSGDQQALTALMMDKGTYPPGQSLERHLAPFTMMQLKDYLGAHGIALQNIRHLRPWFLGLQLALQEAARLGYRADIGVDVHLLGRARGDKRILELETAESQINALAGDSPAEQDLSLRAALEDIAQMDRYLQELIVMWRAGDAEGLHRMMIEPARRYPELQPQMQRLLYERNHVMARKIASMLQTQGVYLVVIGAGHMGGEQGILSLLGDRGHVPRQLPALGVRP